MNSSTSSLQKSDQRSRSSDTFCSSNSSCILKRHKQISHPLATPIRNARCPVIRQRVLSAKMLRFKSMQNKLNDVNFHLAEAMKENQILKNLQKRQDKALSKYEGTKADLPRLLHAHEEEIRILTEKTKSLKKTIRDLNEQVKHREEEIVNLHEQLRHYEKLNKDKHLVEREKLAEQVDDLREQLQKADSQITLLNRKLTLESKNSKQKLNTEAAKYRQSQKELAHALNEVERLSKLVDLKAGRRRFSGLDSKGTSPITSKTNILQVNDDTEEQDVKNPVTEVKLEPIVKRKEAENKPVSHGILKNPVENIKARLSSDSSASFNKSKEELISQNSDMNLSDVCSNESKSRPNSAQKLEKISVSLENTIKKLDNSNKTERTFGNYCTKMMDSMKTCNNIIESHRDNMKTVQSDTDILMESFIETENLEMKLKHTHLLTLDPTDLENEENMDLVSQIFKDELNFKRKMRDPSKNDRKKDNKAIDDSRRRLLETLKAIDRGENVESFNGGGMETQRKGKLMTEIFGDVTD